PLDRLGQSAWVTVGNEHARARVLQRIAQLWLGVARIQRHHHASRRGYCHVNFEVPVAVQRQNGHTIPRLDTELGQGTGQAAAPGPGFGIGQTHVATDYRDMVGKQLLGAVERVNKRVHGTSLHLDVLCEVAWDHSDIMTAVLLADRPRSKVPSY